MRLIQGILVAATNVEVLFSDFRGVSTRFSKEGPPYQVMGPVGVGRGGATV